MSNRKYREGPMVRTHCMPAANEFDPFAGVVAADKPSRLKLWLLGLLLVVIVGCAALGLTGCGLVGNLDMAYVEADRKTLDAVGPEYVEMSKGAWRKKPDGTFEKWFDEEQAERRERSVEAWANRVARGMEK